MIRELVDDIRGRSGQLRRAAHAYNQGSAYILVLVVMLSVFVMAAIVLTATSYEMKISSAYGRYVNLYESAVSGIERTCDFLNTQLQALDGEIVEAVMIRCQDAQLLYALTTAGDPFSGGFYLTDNAGRRSVYGQWYQDAATEGLIRAVSGMAGVQGGSYVYSYTIGAEEEACQVTVEIKPDMLLPDRFCTVTTKAERISVGTSVSARAYLYWSGLPQEAVAIPALVWKYPSEEERYAILATGRIETEDPEATVDGLADPERDFDEEIVNLSINLPSVRWSTDRPVEIMNGEDSVVLDVSAFYDNDTPLPSLLVNNTDKSMEIYASDAAKNQFHGYVVSRGGLTMDDVHMTGRILAKGDVSLLGYTRVDRDADVIFTVGGTDQRLNKMLWDYLRITSFHSMPGGLTDTTGIDSLLGQAGIDGFSLEIKNFDGVALKMVELTEND